MAGPTFRYERQFVESNGMGEIQPLDRAEVKDRLTDWVVDTQVAIEMMESAPNEWHRLSAFAYYRAVPEGVSNG